jgi:hypothetical protein
MITTLSQAPDSIVLEPGQSLRTCVEAGAWLQLAEGACASCRRRAGSASTVFMSETAARRGRCASLPQGGWIEVAALSAVHLAGACAEGVVRARLLLIAEERGR